MGFWNLFGKKNLFSKFSDDEKRGMLKWDSNLLIQTRERRKKGEKATVISVNGGDFSVIDRLSNAELDTIISARELVGKADSISGNKAIALYKKAAELAPWDEIIAQSIGVEYAQAKNFQESLLWLEKALTLNPNSQTVRANYEFVKKASLSSRSK